MKRFSLIITAAIVAMMALSCQKTSEFEAPQAKSDIRTVQLVYPSDALTSKVFLENDGKTGWQTSDVITLHGKVTSENKTIVLDGVTNTISSDGKTATVTVDFTGMTPDDNGYVNTFFAAYPHAAFAELEGDRSRCYNCYNNTNTLLLSGRFDEVNNKFVFFNVTGALSFIVDGSSFGGFDEYIIAGKNGEVVGYDHYNTRVVDDPGDFTFNHYTSSGPKTAVRGSLVDDGSTLNYVYFPVTEASDAADTPGSRAECVDFTDGFYIYLLKSGSIVKMISTSADVRIERQSLLTLGDLTSHVKAYSAPSAHASTHPAIAGATDLGSGGTANSYIVYKNDDGNKDKVFKFKAVKGNSGTGVGAINSVSILWETYNTESSVTAKSVIAEVDFDKQGGDDNYWITFKMPSTLKAGNALIAAKDVYDNILWSWHIWVPATTISTNTYSIYSKALMDRNLGALVVAEEGSVVDVQSFGLLYQWGRKDPFIGAKRNNSSSKASISGSSVSGTPGDGTTDASRITLEESIAHPTLMGHFQGGDWVIPSDNTLWNDDAKSKYDPCPPGYRVPPRETTQPMHSGDLSAVTGWSDNATNKYFTLGSPVAVFPYTGYYDDWSGSYGSGIASVGSRNVLWTAHHGSDKVAYFMNVRNASTHKLEQAGKSRGGSVRCCVDE